MAKEKKKTLSEVFTTAKSLKKKEVFNSIRKYCTQITNDDMKEVHVNIIDYFELNEKDLTKVGTIKTDMGNDQASYWINTFKPIGSNKLRPIFDYLQDQIGSRKTGNKICESINKLNGFDND